MTTMKIVVNGTMFVFSSSSISYDTVVELAQKKGNPSVTYRTAKKGDAQRSGTLTEGQNVNVEDGMRFSVVHTGNA